ncbi:MAG: arylsulfatase [Sphingomonadales bacterium]
MPIDRRGLLETLAAGSLAAAAPPAQSATAAVVRPKHIVMLVLDDVGYADLGCYGSDIETPAIDALARQGLRYQNFHVTSLCAPTRASLLTGRNAHAVGVGTIAEFGSDNPGYQGFIRSDIPTLPEVLRGQGYTTLGLGKWHLSPVLDVNGAGPFEHWPTGRGFDRWYGFHGPIADHWHPELFENTSQVYPSKEGGYHLSEDLAGKAIAYLSESITADPDKPVFLYLAFGACHWPLHVPRADIVAYKGRFDAGWDALRERRLAHQKHLGAVPKDVSLPPLNPDVPRWDSLSDKEKAFAARTMEVYAAFLTHTDRQIGKLLGRLDDLGIAGETAVLLLSDNGASKEGGLLGMSDVRRNHYIERERTAELLSSIELLGTDKAYAAYSRGWTQLSNTPLRFYKSKTYGGGVRAPLIVKWPGIQGGSWRHQWHHVVDIAPTLYETLQLNPKAETDGKSLAYSFKNPGSPTPRRVQYFEPHADRAIWADGYKAAAFHEYGRDPKHDDWALFHTQKDWNELRDISKTAPDVLDRLKDLWLSEAERYSVLPLDDNTTANFAKQVAVPKAVYRFYPRGMRLDRLSAPNIDRYDHRIETVFDCENDTLSGVFLAAGTALAGYELLLVRGQPIYVYAYSRDTHHVLRSSAKVRVGRNALALDYRLKGPLQGSAAMTLNGEGVGMVRIPKMWRLYAASAGVRCGHNPTAPVSRFYEGDGVFEGILQTVSVQLAL